MISRAPSSATWPRTSSWKKNGKTVFPAYKIKAFNGVQVAFIGMTLEGTPSIVSPSGISELRFPG